VNRLIEMAGGKASLVVRAICDGLEDVPPDFRVDMGTYGVYSHGVCFGCAATCAVMKIAGVQFDAASVRSSDSRATEAGLSHRDLLEFEGIVDGFRSGYHVATFLQNLCRVPREVHFDVMQQFRQETYDGAYKALPWSLDTVDWREELSKVRRFAELLAERGY
jgi:hypothetical protein